MIAQTEILNFEKTLLTFIILKVHLHIVNELYSEMKKLFMRCYRCIHLYFCKENSFCTRTHELKLSNSRGIRKLLFCLITTFYVSSKHKICTKRSLILIEKVVYLRMLFMVMIVLFECTVIINVKSEQFG